MLYSLNKPFPSVVFTFVLLWIALTFSVQAANSPLKVVATTGMVADLVRQIGGDRIEVQQLMGAGVDPHLYKPTAADASKLEHADVVFFSGLKLEGRMDDLLLRLGNSGRNVVAVTKDIPEDLLLRPAQFEGHYDPHVWFDVSLWQKSVPLIVATLEAADPEGRMLYEKNGNALTSRLSALDDWCRTTAASLPADRRILITSHDAYNYFGRAYGFTVVGLQGVSTVSEASLSDMVGLVDYIRKNKIKAVFAETSVNPTAIHRISDDSGARIGGELFSDALGAPGEIRNGLDVGTYEGTVRHNLTTIINSLR